MSGPIAVDQALQDPFSNLLQRGALHQRSVTLDVTGVPDQPWSAGTTTLLFGTCKCAQRGQGLHLTVTDPAAIHDAGGGAVRVAGTFQPVVTAADAITLQPAG